MKEEYTVIFLKYVSDQRWLVLDDPLSVPDYIKLKAKGWIRHHEGKIIRKLDCDDNIFYYPETGETVFSRHNYKAVPISPVIWKWVKNK